MKNKQKQKQGNLYRTPQMELFFKAEILTRKEGISGIHNDKCYHA